MSLPIDETYSSGSVGYIVEREDGLRAFLKASDMTLVTEDHCSQWERITILVEAHKFERRINDHCRGSNMDRVAFAIDFGETFVVHLGTKEIVVFLIFDIAKHDLRANAYASGRFSFVTSLYTLHNLAVGIQQLHNARVCHNDLKPSNVLFFHPQMQKIADLGRATAPGLDALHDALICAGDPQYAAPELLYRNPAIDTVPSLIDRRAADLYQLGSIAHYLLAGSMMTPSVSLRLLAPHRPPVSGDGWQGDFASVIPFWRESFGSVVEDLRFCIRTNFKPAERLLAEQMVPIILQLCEPDPAMRGHPLNKRGSNDLLAMERYVSRFDILRQKAMLVR